MKKKLLFVFGTRPEALKLAPVILAAKKDSRFNTVVCLTAQHREMVDQVLDLFKIKPDFDLNVMQPAQSLSGLSQKLLHHLQPVFDRTRPDWVIVQGDTTTAFAASLQAFYSKVKIAHVEAGLRSFNKQQPFPEEINRVLISHLADLHFAPTREAADNLLSERVSSNRIKVTGNTVVDALKVMNSRISAKHLPKPLKPFLSRRLILVTAHRRENFGKPLVSICKAIKRIADQFPDTVVVYPVHLNPQVKDIVHRHLGGHPSVLLLAPLDYLEFTALLKKCFFVLTDSGGVQEEAPSFHKPVLVMREVTERPDGVKMGIAKLVGTSETRITRAAFELLSSSKKYQRMIRPRNPYGDGAASKRILDSLSRFS